MKGEPIKLWFHSKCTTVPIYLDPFGIFPTGDKLGKQLRLKVCGQIYLILKNGISSLLNLSNGKISNVNRKSRVVFLELLKYEI